MLAMVFIAGLATVAAGLWWAARSRRPRPRWQVLRSDSGAFSFVDGEGDLYPVDYARYEEAEESMRTLRAEPPWDPKKSDAASEARQRSYRRAR